MTVKKRDLAICNKTCDVKIFPSQINQNVVKFPAGTLLEVTRRINNVCWVKVRDFTSPQWNGLPPSEIYECDYENLNYVDNDFWPYILGITETAKRYQFFIEFENSGVNVMKDLELEREFNLNAPTKTTNKCKIKYRGVVPENGLGYFIGIELLEKKPTTRGFNAFSKYGNSQYIYRIDELFQLIDLSNKKGRKRLLDIDNMDIEEEEVVEEVEVVFDEPASEDEEKSSEIGNDDQDRNEITKSNTGTIPKVHVQYTDRTFFNSNRPSRGHYAHNTSNDFNKKENWECPKCGHDANYLSRKKCYKCNTQRPKDIEIIRPEQNPSAYPEINFDGRGKPSPNTIPSNFSNKDPDLFFTTVESSCQRCKLDISIGDGITLRRCFHTFCQKCLVYHVRSSDKSAIICLFDDGIKCDKYLEWCEVKGIRAIIKKMDDDCIPKKLEDGNSKKSFFTFCLNLLGKQDNDCNDRSKSVLPEEAMEISEDNQVTILKPEPPTPKTDVEQNLRTFDCFNCEGEIEIGCGVVLRNCGTKICRDCISESLKSQTDYADTGICPICLVDMDDDEIIALGGQQIFDLFTIRKQKKKKALESITEGQRIFECNAFECSGWWIGSESNRFGTCPTCGVKSCHSCNALHDGYTCDEFKIMSNEKNFEPGDDFEAESNEHQAVSEVYMELMRESDKNVNHILKDGNCDACKKPVKAYKGCILKDCLHEVCHGCLTKKIKKAKTTKIKCPVEICSQYLQEREIRPFTDPEKFEQKLTAGFKSAELQTECFNPECSGILKHRLDQKSVKCTSCKYLCCLDCYAIHEKMSCFQYKKIQEEALKG